MSTQQQSRRGNHELRGEVGQWAEDNGLLLELLPFDYKSNDPIGGLQALNRHYQTWPKTKATFSLSQVDHSAPNVHSSVEIPLPVFSGAYRVHESRGKLRWANPRYVHGDTLKVVTDKDRLQYVCDVAEIGVLSLSDVAPRFGVTKDAIFKHLEYHGVSWGDRREEGKRRLARTIKTIVEWTDHSQTEVAGCFATPKRTVNDWVFRHARDYEPPADPTRQQ